MYTKFYPIKNVFFALCILLGTAFISRADIEPNDNIGSATPIPFGELHSGTLGIEPATDANDYYFIELPENGTITITTEADPLLNYRIYLYAENGSLLGTSSFFQGSGELQVDCLGATSYYIRIFKSSGAGSYSVNTSVESQTYPIDSEPNNNIGTANETLVPGSSVTGHLGFNSPQTDNDDFFEVVFEEEGTLHFSATLSEGLSTRLFVYQKNGALISNSTPSEIINELTINCIAPDTLYILVDRTSGCGSYNLQLELNEINFDSDPEPNNNLGQAIDPILANQIVEGRLGYYDIDSGNDSDDYYKILVEENGSVTATASFGEGLSGRVYLYYKNGSLIGSSPVETGETSLTSGCIAADTVIARVNRFTGCGGYSFSFNLSAPEEMNDSEPNNSQALAHELFSPGEVKEGQLGYTDIDLGTDQNDYYRIDVNQDGRVNVQLLPQNSLSARVYVYYSNGAQAAVSPIGTDTVNLSVDCLASDTLFLLVNRYIGCGGYKVSFQIEPPQWNIDDEPNNSQAQAQLLLSPGEITEGHLGYYRPGIGTDQSDYYLMNVVQNGSVTATANFDQSLSGRIYFYYSNGAQAGVSPIDSETASLTVDCLASDTLYALVYLYTGCGSYQFQFDISPPSLAEDNEPNNTLAEANEINNGAVVTGHLGYYRPATSTDKSDYYKLTVVSAPFEMEVTALFYESLNARLYLYNSSGSQLMVTSVDSEQATLNYTFENPGDYYVLVYHHTGCGSYSLGDFCANHPEVEVSAQGPVDFCPGDEVELSGTASLAGYEWFKDGLPVGNSPNLIAQEAGIYQLVAIDENYCGTLSEPIEVTHFEVPELTLSANGELEFCQGGSVELTASNGFDQYEWSNGATDQSTEVTESGNFYALATTSDGCEALSDTLTVNVLDPGHPDCLDCPDLGGNVGDTCDDDDSSTVNDTITESCECAGTPLSDCPGDFDNNFSVGTSDLLLLIGEFGCASDCQTDMDGNDSVATGDLLIFLSYFGTSCIGLK